MSTVTFKATFRATRTPQSPAVAKDAAALGTSPKPPVSRAAPMLALAHLIDRRVEAAELRDYAEAARMLGVTRARVTQIVGMLNLSPAIQDAILNGSSSVAERSLRPMAMQLEWRQQELLFRASGAASSRT